MEFHTHPNGDRRPKESSPPPSPNGGAEIHQSAPPNEPLLPQLDTYIPSRLPSAQADISVAPLQAAAVSPVQSVANAPAGEPVRVGSGQVVSLILTSQNSWSAAGAGTLSLQQAVQAPGSFGLWVGIATAAVHALLGGVSVRNEYEKRFCAKPNVPEQYHSGSLLKRCLAPVGRLFKSAGLLRTTQAAAFFCSAVALAKGGNYIESAAMLLACLGARASAHVAITESRMRGSSASDPKSAAPSRLGFVMNTPGGWWCLTNLILGTSANCFASPAAAAFNITAMAAGGAGVFYTWQGALMPTAERRERRGPIASGLVATQLGLLACSNAIVGEAIALPMFLWCITNVMVTRSMLWISRRQPHTSK
ncbi:MAG: hypothetical protein DCC75_02475 [Proteobacteria bacterium]|nr:MAG: hypothetical protein DCC75_02475 [Pseudomonadota bacterium]